MYGDINKDGIVDILDISSVASVNAITKADVDYDIKCDLNEDGVIDILDI